MDLTAKIVSVDARTARVFSARQNLQSQADQLQAMLVQHDRELIALEGERRAYVSLQQEQPTDPPKEPVVG